MKDGHVGVLITILLRPRKKNWSWKRRILIVFANRPSQNEFRKRAVQARNAPVFAPVFTALRRGELLRRGKECGMENPQITQIAQISFSSSASSAKSADKTGPCHAPRPSAFCRSRGHETHFKFWMAIADRIYCRMSLLTSSPTDWKRGARPSRLPFSASRRKPFPKLNGSTNGSGATPELLAEGHQHARRARSPQSSIPK